MFPYLNSDSVANYWYHFSDIFIVLKFKKTMHQVKFWTLRCGHAFLIEKYWTISWTIFFFNWNFFIPRTIEILFFSISEFFLWIHSELDSSEHSIREFSGINFFPNLRFSKCSTLYCVKKIINFKIYQEKKSGNCLWFEYIQ